MNTLKRPPPTDARKGIAALNSLDVLVLVDTNVFN